MRNIGTTNVTRAAETEGAGADAGADAKRNKVSRRGYVGPNGTVVERIEDAAGGSYTLLGDGGKTFTSLDLDSKALQMFAILGFHTKLGNVANSILNSAEWRGQDGAVAEAAAAIEEFLSDVAGGVWAERGEGGAARKIDLDALTEATCMVQEAKGAWTAEQIATSKKANLRAALESDAKLKRALNADPAIKAQYAALTGRKVVNVDDALAGL